MKVSFPTVVSRSGSDVYFDLLVRALPLHGITARQIPLSHRHEFIPVLSQAEREAIDSGDLIHTAVEHGSLVHVPGKPLILTALHNVITPEYQDYTSPLQKLFHRLLIHPRQAKALHLATRVICISEFTRRSYALAYPDFADKLQVIYNGVDLERFRKREEGTEAQRHKGAEVEERIQNTKVRMKNEENSFNPKTSALSAKSADNSSSSLQSEILNLRSKILNPQSEIGNRQSAISSLLFVGHLTRRKGADLLPAIMDLLGPGHELICVGQRNENVSETTTPSGARIRVLPPVSQDELITLYQQCDLLLFPTRLEGFGYAVAEAMACGKPVVATNCSAIPELIDHEQGGILCPMDNVAAFAEGVRKILSDSTLAAAMGTYNRAKAERLFSLDHMIEQYVEVYEREG